MGLKERREAGQKAREYYFKAKQFREAGLVGEAELAKAKAEEYEAIWLNKEDKK